MQHQTLAEASEDNVAGARWTEAGREKHAVPIANDRIHAVPGRVEPEGAAKGERFANERECAFRFERWATAWHHRGVLRRLTSHSRERRLRRWTSSSAPRSRRPVGNARHICRCDYLEAGLRGRPDRCKVGQAHGQHEEVE